MEFVNDNYRMLHLGRGNQICMYNMGNSELSYNIAKKDAGVIVDMLKI